jgi:hypothetical protein
MELLQFDIVGITKRFCLAGVRVSFRVPYALGMKSSSKVNPRNFFATMIHTNSDVMRNAVCAILSIGDFLRVFPDTNIRAFQRVIRYE